ncbi:phosphatidate cytidylyltransferase, partial [Staphylococcus aureus]|uniref:phosphatidate cytidylyltransferase n=1 Tax=Staphylococcus aureus TaxID=1280 RepID=UPI00210A07EB
QHAGAWVQVIQLEILISMSFILLSYTVVSENEFSFMDASFCLVSVADVGIGFMFFYEKRSEGLHYILYAFLIVWLKDTGAYLFGKMMGKHKLWHVISPNKTIEGFIGGLLCSLIVPLEMLERQSVVSGKRV